MLLIACVGLFVCLCVCVPVCMGARAYATYTHTDACTHTHTHQHVHTGTRTHRKTWKVHICKVLITTACPTCYVIFQSDFESSQWTTVILLANYCSILFCQKRPTSFRFTLCIQGHSKWDRLHYRVVQTRKMTHFRMSFSAKEPYNQL